MNFQAMPKESIKDLSPREYIIIKGARVHNLKNIDVAIKKSQLTVITGLSGSGKSSLAFDTLYSEGQRRYVESLSSYARQFLGRMNKPEVEYIKGISPAIAIEQKVNTRNPRSTVGTSTEIYEYLKLLFARIGRTISPESNQEVKRHSVTDVCNFILGLAPETTVLILSPLPRQEDRSLDKQLEILIQQGFSRIMFNGEMMRLEQFREQKTERKKNDCIHIVVDRIVLHQENDGEHIARINDSVQTAFFEGNGECLLQWSDEKGNSKQASFSNRFELDGITFEQPSVNLFTFNNPYGACRKCEGFGSVIGIDEDLVIPNKSLSIYEDAVVCWKGEKLSEWKHDLIACANKIDFPIHRPYSRLTEEQKTILWEGKGTFFGINGFFRMVEENTYKIQYRVLLSRFRGKTVCPDCKGTRLRKDANYVKISGKSISELVLMPIEKLMLFFKELQLSAFDQEVARRLLLEINSRLQFLCDVGLGYLTLNRLSNTLSGGESQRINLATSLGSSLVGSMYILDEPSIGLHPRDTHRLIDVLKQLRDLGNTVIVVEHDEDMMHAADQIIDIGPRAGAHGGEIVAQGSYHEIIASKDSLTASYLNGSMSVPVPSFRRKWKEFIEIKGARQHNLKGIDVKIPLKILTVVTGVSGSGKTSLIKNIFYPAIKKIHGGHSDKTGKFDQLSGDINSIHEVEMVDQNPIGRSSRSNPATYLKVYDEIRTLFSNQPLAKTRGYGPGYFSFNIEGGRCPECEGEGEVKIEMQFMADISLVCDACKGKRFKQEILEIIYKGKSVSDILDLTVDEAISFFGEDNKTTNSAGKRIAEKLKPLTDVGLGYIRLGQSSSTLSGGEAQRVKLAFFLSKGRSAEKTLFIFDEPTTGLHFHDIHQLMNAFNALIDNGHSLVVIEHNMDIIKSADWIIDLGPEGGEHGGNIVFEGTPEELINCKGSYTGKYLASKIGTSK